MKLAKLGHNPTLDVREPDLPVGLKVLYNALGKLSFLSLAGQNLGATCYANASIQVVVLICCIASF